MAALPKDFPPWQTIYGTFRSLRALGVLEQICRKLVRLARYAAGARVEPTTVLLDSQTVKTTETGGFKVQWAQVRHRIPEAGGHR